MKVYISHQKSDLQQVDCLRKKLLRKYGHVECNDISSCDVVLLIGGYYAEVKEAEKLGKKQVQVSVDGYQNDAYLKKINQLIENSQNPSVTQAVWKEVQKLWGNDDSKPTEKKKDNRKEYSKDNSSFLGLLVQRIAIFYFICLGFGYFWGYHKATTYMLDVLKEYSCCKDSIYYFQYKDYTTSYDILSDEIKTVRRYGDIDMVTEILEEQHRLEAWANEILDGRSNRRANYPKNPIFRGMYICGEKVADIMSPLGVGFAYRTGWQLRQQDTVEQIKESLKITSRWKYVVDYCDHVYINVALAKDKNSNK